jgi:hypothetical protein
VRRFFFIFILVFSVHAFAGTIESETDLGALMSSEAVTGNGDFPASESKQKSTIYSWNLGFVGSSSTTIDPNSGSKIVDKTSDWTFGFGLDTVSKVSFDVGLEYSRTPDENLTAVGPNLSLGYTYEFSSTHKKKRKDDDGDDFNPDITARLTYAALNYAQTFAKGAPRRLGVVRPTAGETTIKQNSLGVSLSSNILPWFSLKVSETGYSYNQDPNKFISTLDSTRGLATLTAGLSSTVTGFPKSETLIKATFFLGEDWVLYFEEIAAKSIVDGSTALTGKGVLSRYFGDSWSVGVGYENESSDQLTDHLAVVDVKYLF